MFSDQSDRNKVSPSLHEMREAIDRIDEEIVRLFEARMEQSRKIARYKQIHHLDVLDAGREEAVLKSRSAMVRDPLLAPAARKLFTCIMAISREAQHTLMESEQPMDETR